MVRFTPPPSPLVRWFGCSVRTRSAPAPLAVPIPERRGRAELSLGRFGARPASGGAVQWLSEALVGRQLGFELWLPQHSSCEDLYSKIESFLWQDLRSFSLL